jgi:hypothetical protein
VPTLRIWVANVTASRQRLDSFLPFTDYFRVSRYAHGVAEADPFISPSNTTVDRGHILRSRYLDHFAQLEDWVTQRALEILPTMKANVPLSQKLNILDREAGSGTSRFRNPNHVKPLIEQIKSAALTRSHLAHAVMTTAVTDDERCFWMFKNVGQTAGTLTPFQLVLDSITFEREIRELKTLRRKLDRQSLKAAVPDAPAPANG